MDLEIADAAPPGFDDTLSDLLNGFNAGRAGVWRNLVIAVPDPATGRAVGGMTARTGGGYLHIRYLALPEWMRRRGIGRRLMRMAEAEAVQRGCHAAWLRTFDFQGRPFYERLGYTTFGTLDAFPPGHRCLFMRKSLQGHARGCDT